jgi:hypothetical protein
MIDRYITRADIIGKNKYHIGKRLLFIVATVKQYHNWSGSKDSTQVFITIQHKAMKLTKL